MVKGEKPYDQAAVDEALKALDDTAKKLPTMFPESTKGLKPEGDYSSSPKIWEDKAGFAAKIESFAKVVTEAKAKIKDLDSLKATVPAIGKECGGCHETFRLKNELIIRIKRNRAGARSVRPVLSGRQSAKSTWLPDRGFRRPDWLRCEC